MISLLLLAVIVLGIVAYNQHRNLARLRQDLDHYDQRLGLVERRPDSGLRPAGPAIVDTPPAEPAHPQRASRPVPPVPALAAAPQPRVDRPAPPPPAPSPQPRPAISFESLIGGRLPIWIGGVALVLAGFFLVRYSIEAGLLGPTTRTILAAIFAATLIIGSEVTRRITATRDDPRVAQALAGAGVASFYATLYMAAALYHLVGPVTGFGLMLAITALALALSLRHGPPTAIMALGGGFIAPLVAGWNAAGIGPLLVYLGLFTAAIFGLAVNRRWGWLALAATGAGFAWVNFLLAMLGGGDLATVGGFVVILAAGASAALPATGIRTPWLRLLPLVAGLIQLIAIAPVLQFDALAWSFYLVLAAASLFLAWHDRVFLPGALAAIGLLLLLEALALVQPELGVTPVAAALATALFAGAGHVLARRHAGWAAIALAGTAGPVLIAHGCARVLLAPIGWSALELVAAAAAASLAWRYRGERPERILVAATLVAGLLAAIGLGVLVPTVWLALPLTAILVAAALWARRIEAPTLFELPTLPLAAALIAATPILVALASAISASLFGLPGGFTLLPGPGEALRALALPLLAASALLLTDRRQFGKARAGVAGAIIALAILVAWVLAKQVLHLDTPQALTMQGFVERTIFTQACLAAGWALLVRARQPRLGWILIVLGLFRVVWFDLLALNPVVVGQWSGPIVPLHLSATGLWLRSLPGARERRLDLAGLGFLLLAVAAAVRWLTHGWFLTGPVSTLENGAYSAALLVVALVWLWRGIAGEAKPLRIAGLALLTLVTLKVFLIDAAALDGILRILSFLGLGLALIVIGWAYGRFVGKGAAPAPAIAGLPDREN